VYAVCRLGHTDCPIQAGLGWIPDKPDIIVFKDNEPYLYCEVKVRQKTNEIAWDRQRLARFGRAFLAKGHRTAFLIQIAKNRATYMTMRFVDHIFILQKIGTFQIPLKRGDLEKLLDEGGILPHIRVSFDSFELWYPLTFQTFTYDHLLYYRETSWQQ
jgi:hypothetical protein